MIRKLLRSLLLHSESAEVKPDVEPPELRRKRKKSRATRKRKAFKRGVRLNPDASILAQVQDLGR